MDVKKEGEAQVGENLRARRRRSASRGRGLLLASTVDGQNSAASLQLWDLARQRPLATVADQSSDLHFIILEDEGRVGIADEDEIRVVASRDDIGFPVAFPVRPRVF